MRHDATRRYAPNLVLGAIACGLCFIAIKAFEYHEKIAAGRLPNTNEFYMYYFVLTGLHLAHVIVVVAVFKVRLIGLYFMELNAAPWLLRGLFEGYCILLLALLLGFYVFG